MKKLNNYWIVLMVLATTLLSQPGLAALKIDKVYFDPPIIAAGDEVDVVIQYTYEEGPLQEYKVNDPAYKFKVTLESDDALTKQYVLITDPEGDDVKGTIYSGQSYNKVFRVKVKPNAPPASYQFKLTGQWYRDGEPLSSKQYVRFYMPVKKEGVLIGVSQLETIPAEVRPGDDFVRLRVMIENTGEKDAKAVEVALEPSKGLEHSYSNKNRAWIGRLNAGEAKEANFFINVDEKAAPGVYALKYRFKYMDLDNNEYEKEEELPFLVKRKPYLEVVRTQGSGLAGGKGVLKVTVKNTGTESAEAVDVRLLKKSSQPFQFEARSDYGGELMPGEEGTAIFEFDIDRSAALKNHSFQLLIRAKGDSDEGDENVYTFTRRALFEVKGKAPNKLLRAGLLAMAALLIGILAGKAKGLKKKRR